MKGKSVNFYHKLMLMNTVSKISILFTLMFMSACQPSGLQNKLASCQEELKETKAAYEEAQSQLQTSETDPKLVHTVYLNIKDDISAEDKNFLLSGIKSLSSIPGVNDFKSGTFKDLGDQRALSTYEVVLQMEFLDESAYQKYQQDSIHLAFKKRVGHLLAGPPATHDFIEQ